MTNFIPDQNRFSLEGPPKWWLRKLWEFDPSLVVIPSRQEFLYRLAQRRPPDLKANVVHASLATDRDTAMLASYGLIPVTTILATAKWDNPLMWKDLEERSPSRQGGAEAYERKLNEIERKKQLDVAKENNERNQYLSKDGWKYYQIKTGKRIGFGPATKSVAPKPTFGKAPGLIIPKG